MRRKFPMQLKVNYNPECNQVKFILNERYYTGIREKKVEEFLTP